MATARDIMTPGAEHVSADDTVVDVARRLEEQDVGALPVCGGDGQLVGIGADDSVEEALRTMADHAVRRLPVIDGTELVGMVSQADVARACPPDQVGKVVEAISAAP